MGRAGGGLHIGEGRSRPGVGDVLPHRAAEQRGILGHDADGAPQIGEAERADVDAVEEHTAPVRVPEPGQQRDQRRLAPARGAHQRDHLTGRAGQVDALEDPGQRRVTLVPEGDALERDASARR